MNRRSCVNNPGFYSIGMFDVVVVSTLKFLKLAENGFHKLSKGCGIYVVLQYLMLPLIQWAGQKILMQTTDF